MLKNGFVGLDNVRPIVALFLLTKDGGETGFPDDHVRLCGGITIGSVAAELATDLDAPLNSDGAGDLRAGGGWHLPVDQPFPTAQCFTAPLVLLENGVIYRENLKKAKLISMNSSPFAASAGGLILNQLQTAILEHNGIVSFLPKETDWPATLSDLGQTPKTVPQTPLLSWTAGCSPAISGRRGRRSCSPELLQGYQEEKDVRCWLCGTAGKAGRFSPCSLQNRPEARIETL